MALGLLGRLKKLCEAQIESFVQLYECCEAACCAARFQVLDALDSYINIFSKRFLRPAL